MFKKSNKTVKTCKWLALGATLALASAFVVPAVFNESPVAIEETVKAEQTYTDINMFALNANYNNRSGNQMLITAQLNGVSQTIDRTQEFGTFFTNATLEVNGVTKTLAEAGFGLYGGTGDQHNGNFIWISYTAIAAPAENAMHTLTVPAGTTLYNYKFASEYKIYYYNGWWNNDPIVKTTDEAYVLTDAASIAISSSHNHTADGTQLLLYSYASGSTSSIAFNFDYAEGNFWSNIKLNGEATDKFVLAKSNYPSTPVGNTADGTGPIDLRYAADAEFWKTTDESYHTLTIPADTTLFNIKFAEEMNLYFYNGQWQLTKPVTIEYTEITNILIEPDVNHSLVWGSHRHLVFYFQVNGVSQTPDRTVGTGNFFSNVTFEGESLKNSGFIYQGEATYGQGSPFFIQYVDADWTDPEEGEVYKMTIPAGTTVFNFKIKSEINVYFYEGKWSLTERISESEKVYTAPNQLVIANGFNGSIYNGKPTVLFYAWYKTGSGVPHNFVYGEGNFNEKTTLIEYTNGVQTNVYEDKVNYVWTAHVTDGGTAITLQYDTDNDFWAKTTDKYYKFNIPAGTTLYATKFETEMNLYYINGYWTTIAPDEVASVYGASLSLTGNIGVNFYVNIPYATLSDTDAYVQIKHGETTKQIPVSEGVEKNGYYVFSYQVTSAQTADDIALTVFRNVESISGDKTDNASVTLHYSVEKYAEDYAKYCEQNPEAADEKLTALINATVNYGDYANAYFGGGEALADIESVTAADFEGVAATQKGESANVTDISASLVLGSETSIKVYFKYTGEGEPVCKVAGETVTANYDEAKGMYYITKANINAANLDINYAFEIDGVTVTYSAYVYFKDVIAENADAKLVNLVKATYLYSLAAEAYFA